MSDTRTPPTMSALLGGMAKGTTTHGWDMICSYTEDRLNALLAKKHADGSLVTSLSYSTSYYTPRDGYLRDDYTIQLGAPALQFTAVESGLCLLNMPIVSAHYTSTPVDAEGNVIPGGKVVNSDLPTGYSLVATVPLGAVTGNGKVTAANTVVTFGSTDDKAKIVLHFDMTTGGTFEVKPEVTDPDFVNMTNNFLQHFRAAANVSEIDYSLTEVNNSTPPNTSGLAVTPKNFIFATEAGVLSLYILTENSGNATHNNNPVFDPGDVQMLPVPQGYTASLIFSNDFIKKVYLTPGLGGIGTVKYDDTVASGIALQLAYNKSIEYKTSHDDGSSAVISDPVKIDFNKTPFYINFQGDKATISWRFKQEIEWGLFIYDYDAETHQRVTTHADSGTVAVSISLNKDKAEKTDVSDTSLDVSFDIKGSDFDIKVTGTGKKDFLNAFNSYEDEFKNELRDLFKHAGLPSIKLDFGTLQIFAVTNLLFPGESILKIDAAAGILIPFDLILLGDVKTEPVAAV